MILDGDLGEVSSEQREFLKKTYRANERMISLVNSLLNVSRIEEGRFVYQPTLVSLERLTILVKKPLEEQARRKKIQIRFERPKKALPKVLVDVEKIRLVVQNLIENAIKYTPSKGKIVISLGKEGAFVKFKIKDNGLGIPARQQNRVFKKFFRGANAVRLETEGTGLGLFIVKNIVEAHGGRVWFESEENKGTTFYFTLPVKSKS
jgi:signal transduction histidine kinase